MWDNFVREKFKNIEHLVLLGKFKYVSLNMHCLVSKPTKVKRTGMQSNVNIEQNTIWDGKYWLVFKKGHYIIEKTNP